jgi:hypothetical protein
MTPSMSSTQTTQRPRTCRSHFSPCTWHRNSRGLRRCKTYRSERAGTRALFVAHAPLWLDANLGPGRLSAGIIAANLDNPGARQVARVLGLLGMNDVFANVELPDAANPTKRLNEMAGVRNSIAHGGFPSVGEDQAWDYVDSVGPSAMGSSRRLRATFRCSVGSRLSCGP